MNMKTSIPKILGEIILKIIPKKISNKWISKIAAENGKLYIGDESEVNARGYVAEKLGVSILCAVGICLIGIIYMLRYPSGINISNVTRPKKNEGEKNLKLVAHYEDETEEINVRVGEKKLLYQEAMEEMDEAFREVKVRMLNNNPSSDKVSENLDFISDLSEFEVKLIWDVEDEEVIGLDGSINYKGEESVITKVFLTEVCGEYSKSYEITLKVMGEGERERIEEYVQSYVDDQEENEEVVLPQSIGDKSISFTKKKDYLGIIICIFGGVFSVIVFYGKDQNINEEIRKKNEEGIIDYPDILGKYLLLCRAGLSNISAIGRIVKDYEKENKKRYAYEELKLMLKKINLGKNEVDCYEEFGRRMGGVAYMKLAVLMEERMVKGNREISSEMELELKKAWEERSKVIRIYGQRAGTKLVMPMVLILMVTLSVIIFPAFLGIRGGL